MPESEFAAPETGLHLARTAYLFCQRNGSEDASFTIRMKPQSLKRLRGYNFRKEKKHKLTTLRCFQHTPNALSVLHAPGAGLTPGPDLELDSL